MKNPHLPNLSRVFLAIATLVVAVALGTPMFAWATCNPDQDSCSNNYGVSEPHFGSGSQLNACSHGSTGYCADESAGDLTVGNTSSPNYQAQAGSGLTTKREPYLEVIVGGAPSDLGYLSGTNAVTTTANFTVKTYLASGYQVQIVGAPPTSAGAGAHTFAAMNNGAGGPTSSSPGSEQFGINLIANTTNPDGTSGGLGANPSCSPDPSFCPSGAMVSAITTNYNQDGKYFYPSGPNYTDTLINSNTSTGDVSYTISFVYNISNLTPDGQYTYNGDVVVTSTF